MVPRFEGGRGRLARLETDGYVAESDCLLLNETRNRLLIGPGFNYGREQRVRRFDSRGKFRVSGLQLARDFVRQENDPPTARKFCIHGLNVIGV